MSVPAAPRRTANSPASRPSTASIAAPYDAIGTVNYEFATLSGYRGQISPPAAPPRFVVEKGQDDLEIVINAPLKAVYQTLINVDKRPEWLDGVDTINREMTSERIGMRHNCVFHGLKLINTAVYRDFHEDHARYSERVEIPEIKVTLQADSVEMYSPASRVYLFHVVPVAAGVRWKLEVTPNGATASDFACTVEVRLRPGLGVLARLSLLGHFLANHVDEEAHGFAADITRKIQRTPDAL